MFQLEFNFSPSGIYLRATKWQGNPKKYTVHAGAKKQLNLFCFFQIRVCTFCAALADRQTDRQTDRQDGSAWDLLDKLWTNTENIASHKTYFLSYRYDFAIIGK